jgi:acetyl esterase/lipase
MPSIRARLLNAYLRATTRSLWRPDLDIDQIRGHSARMDRLIGRFSPPVETEAVQIDGRIPATWIGSQELAERNGVLLYLHGGAFCIHLPLVYRRMLTLLSRLSGLRVLLVDYRLAPEHPFPAASDDCLAAYRWLAERGLGGRGLAVAGDSAGGNLTLVTLQQARDEGLPMPACGVALSPVTDLTQSGASADYNADRDPMFSRAADGLLQKIYCEGFDLSDSRLSPLFGRWEGLPPLLFHAGSTELLLDDSIRAQDRARAAGVAARIKVWPDLPHVFHVFGTIPEHRHGLAEIADFLREHAVLGAQPLRLSNTDPAPDLGPGAPLTELPPRTGEPFVAAGSHRGT